MVRQRMRCNQARKLTLMSMLECYRRDRARRIPGLQRECVPRFLASILSASAGKTSRLARIVFSSGSMPEEES